MNFRKRYYRILKAAGIEIKGLHSLRHTFATRLVNGVKQPDGTLKTLTPRQVADILGHSTSEITERFSVSDPEQRQETMQHLREYLNNYVDKNNRAETRLMSLGVQFPSDQAVNGSIDTIACADGTVNITGKTLEQIGGAVSHADINSYGKEIAEAPSTTPSRVRSSGASAQNSVLSRLRQTTSDDSIFGTDQKVNTKNQESGSQ